MKKLVLALFAIVVCNVGANAYVDNMYMTTAQYLQNTGYSAEMARLMKITNQDPYREPYSERKTFKNIMKRSYNYIAPGTFTDMDFYNHNINVNNPSWTDL